MPAVIFRITPALRENWNRAIEAELWDTTADVKKVRIEPGTQVFFWMNGKSSDPRNQRFLGRAIATTPLSPMSEATRQTGPWVEPDEEKIEKYKFRLEFENLDIAADVPVSVSEKTRSQELGQDLGINIAQQTVIAIEDPQKISLINNKYFSGQPPIMSNEVDSAVLSQDVLGGIDSESESVIRTALLKHRRNAREFRSTVSRNFYSRCAVTGEAMSGVLDAAHIIPFDSQPNTDRVDNGVLLRVDIHRLFDRHLITFVSEGEEILIHCSEALKRTSYWDFHQKPITEPRNKKLDLTALEQHNDRCSWFIR